MSLQSVVINSRYQSYGLPQQTIGRFTLLSMVLLSSLLYGAVGPIAAGESPAVIVEVKLTEFSVEMPKTVPPGPLTFSVTNAGTMEHNFEIEGEGIEKKFDTNLKPGETRSLPVDLPAGTYRVYCPVKDHREHGLQLELKVAQQQANRLIRPVVSQVLLQTRVLAKW
jgi:Cupredoxin-like domain